MEIKKTIKAPSEYIFDKIIESCLYDIQKQTGSKPKPSALTGFEYEKKFNKNQSGRIKLDEVTVPTVYAFSTFTNRNTFHTRWELAKKSGTEAEVVITEQQETFGFIQKLNDILVGALIGHFKKKQILAVLDNIELQYLGKG